MDGPSMTMLKLPEEVELTHWTITTKDIYLTLLDLKNQSSRWQQLSGRISNSGTVDSVTWDSITLRNSCHELMELTSNRRRALVPVPCRHSRGPCELSQRNFITS